MSNKGSNKALWFKDIEIIKVYSFKNSKRNTIIMIVNLKYIKNKEKDRTLYVMQWKGVILYFINFIL